MRIFLVRIYRGILPSRCDYSHADDLEVTKFLTSSQDRTQANRHNNQWYCRRDPNVVIVFIHGIFSNSQSCWLHRGEVESANVFWPDLVRDDNRFGTPSLYLAGYYTALDSGDFSLRDCARDVLEALQRTERDGTPPVMRAATIVFIAHSTGGIVVRYMLERNKEFFQDKAIGLLLIASPSLGAVWANVASLAAMYYGQKLGLQLRWQGETLVEIHDRFRDLVDRRAQLMPRLFGMEACENKMIFRETIPRWIRWAIPSRWKLVTTLSAGQYFGPVKELRNTDHFTTVKPSGFEHPAHEFLVTFMRLFFESIASFSQSTAVLAQEPPLMRLCSELATLLQENRRVFSAFGPSALRQGADINLWRKQRSDVIAPNNRAILKLLRMRGKEFPDSARLIIETAMSHFEAFEVNQADRIDYRNFMYPRPFSTLVALARAGGYHKSYDRHSVKLWIRWKVAEAKSMISKSFLFGSILVSPETANDIDVAVLYHNEKTDTPGHWVKSIDTESRMLFDLPMHVTLFEYGKEHSDYDHFLNKCVQRASAQAVPVIIVPEECDL